MGGYLFAYSAACDSLDGMVQGYADALEGYPDMLDYFADFYLALGYYDDAEAMREKAAELRDEIWEMRSSLTDVTRDAARTAHDYGLYFLVGALLSLVGGAGLLAWRWPKK